MFLKIFEKIADIDMLLMIEKGIRGGIYNAIHHYAKAKINIWMIMVKMKNLRTLITGV